MQLALRRGFGYAFDPGRGMRGLGEDTTTLDIGGGYVGAPMVITSNDPVPDGSLYSQLIAQGVNPVDAAAYLETGQLPGGSTGLVTPGVELTTAELAAEQSRASAWLATIPGALSTASKIGLTAAQIAAGVQSGGLKPSSTCPSGYMIAGSAQCVVSTTSTPLIAGVSNTALAIGALVFFAFMMMGKKR